ncbi:hypothetical protein BD626DRAFT_525828 [Schizophyllum amplum]|uniref:Uncharacterized protein n=1 Tax=Schizophyllum amplum TaxID=97359 RepID=A0A550BSF9_9AGAR|nr:hypothetical protein BD626DRAFT_525828 [Auriculariopsis ampla]
MVDLSESKRHYNKDIRPASLFPDLQIAYFIYGSNHWLFSFCRGLRRLPRSPSAAARRGHSRNHVKRIQQGYEAVLLRIDDLSSPVLGRVIHFGRSTTASRIIWPMRPSSVVFARCLDLDCYRNDTGADYLRNVISQIQPFDCDSEFMSMKSAVSDAIKVSDDIGFTRFMVSIWVDKDEQRANMIKAYNQELHEGNRY